MSQVAQWQRICLPSRRQGFNPCAGKIPWRRKWQPTPVFLPGKSHGQRSLMGYIKFSSVQLLSHVRLFATPWIIACQASLSITNFQSPPKPVSIESVMPSSHLILCRPLLLLPPIPPSIRVFSNESTLRMSWPKYWSFSFSISPSNEHPGLISFRMDKLDLLAVQGTLKSLLQHHSYLASKVLKCHFCHSRQSLTPNKFNWSGCGIYLYISLEKKELMVPFWRLSTTPFHRILWWYNIFIICW